MLFRKENKIIRLGSTYRTEKARTVKSLFQELKRADPTTVSKWSEGMVWKGDVMWSLRNSKGDWVNVGFSLNPQDDEMTIYETYTKKKVRVKYVNDFIDALKELGIEDQNIQTIRNFISI